MASETAHFYEPGKGHGLRHDPFNSIIAPRPIGWISTLGADGTANLAPYSFFNALNYDPPLIGFSSIGWKDSVSNIESSREFCWNLASKPLAEAMNLSCAPAPADVDEFELAGLTKAPSRLVRVPRVLESAVNFECKLSQILQLQDANGTATETWLIVGEVVAVHIEQDLIASGTFDTIAAQPILRGGGPADYFSIEPENRFQMRRPEWPQANQFKTDREERT